MCERLRVTKLYVEEFCALVCANVLCERVACAKVACAQCHKCHACHANGTSISPSATPVSKMVCDKVLCEKGCLTKLCMCVCVTKLCVKDGA